MDKEPASLYSIDSIDLSIPPRLRAFHYLQLEWSQPWMFSVMQQPLLDKWELDAAKVQNTPTPSYRFVGSCYCLLFVLPVVHDARQSMAMIGTYQPRAKSGFKT